MIEGDAPSEFVVGSAAQRLFHMAELVLPALSDSGPGMVLADGRKLALATRRAHPARLEAFIGSDLTSSFSHVAALAAVVRAGTVFPYVPLSMLRPVIESAAASLWILRPTARDERARRAVLRLARSQQQYERFITGLKGGQYANERMDESLRLAYERLGIDMSNKDARKQALEAASTTRILASVDDASRQRHRVSLWRACSAWSHNDVVFVANVSPRAEDAEAPEGTFHIRIEAQENWLELAALTAGSDLARVLHLSRESGVRWPGSEEAVSQAITLFPNADYEDHLARLARRHARR